ncbi:MAG: ribbon-helix-helix domain-containing protein [Candidatus Kariarchaeaceae archaeon]
MPVTFRGITSLKKEKYLICIGVPMNSNDIEGKSLSPLTFKIPGWMLKKMERMIEEGEYDTKAELIRDAIQKLIDWELSIPSVKKAVKP